jgi:hypothetical protein
MWLSSDVQEQQQCINIAVKKKLKAVYFLGVLAVIWLKPVCSVTLKMEVL